jgi:nucleoside-diphosphate-sugar epimerase
VKVLVIGCGLVGTPLARRLRADGHHVTGTTTTPDKVEALRADACDEVLVLRGTDAEAVAAAVGAADAVIVTAGPSAQRSMTPEDRAVHYREVLADTARNVAPRWATGQSSPTPPWSSTATTPTTSTSSRRTPR